MSRFWESCSKSAKSGQEAESQTPKGEGCLGLCQEQKAFNPQPSTLNPFFASRGRGLAGHTVPSSDDDSDQAPQFGSPLGNF